MAEHTQVMTVIMPHQDETVVTTHLSTIHRTLHVPTAVMILTMLVHVETADTKAEVVAAIHIAVLHLATAVLQTAGQTEVVTHQEAQTAGEAQVHRTLALAAAVVLYQAAVAAVVHHAEAVVEVVVAAEAVAQDNKLPVEQLNYDAC